MKIHYELSGDRFYARETLLYKPQVRSQWVIHRAGEAKYRRAFRRILIGILRQRNYCHGCRTPGVRRASTLATDPHARHWSSVALMLGDHNLLPDKRTKRTVRNYGPVQSLMHLQLHYDHF